MSFAEELRKIVRGEVEDAPTALEKYSRDASLFSVRPQVIVYPKDADDVCRLVKFVNAKATPFKTKGSPFLEHRFNITVRAAGTDMGGGPLGNSIILDTTRYL